MHLFSRSVLGGTLLAALGLATPLPAQSLLGLENGSIAASGQLLQGFDTNCQAGRSCIVRVFGPSIPAPFGGVAVDERDGTVWATDGIVLVHLDRDCEVIERCPLGPAFGGRVTGLEWDPRDDSLWFTDTTNTIYHAPAGCPLIQVRRLCTVPPQQLGGSLTGITVDRFDGTLWVVDEFGVVLNLQPVTPTNACRVISFFRAACPNAGIARPVQGIALDRCKEELYLSHADYGIARFDLAGNPRGCCSLPSPGPGPAFVGLAWVPDPARVLGRGCTSRECGVCTPSLEAPAASVVPNPAFALVLRGAPDGSRFFLLFHIAGGPIAVPGFCGPFQVALLPPPLAVGPFATVGNPGGTPCSNAARIPLAIPLDPALCGGDVFAQAFGFCASGAGLGHFLSNGLWITVQ